MDFSQVCQVSAIAHVACGAILAELTRVIWRRLVVVDRPKYSLKTREEILEYLTTIDASVLDLCRELDLMKKDLGGGIRHSDASAGT